MQYWDIYMPVDPHRCLYLPGLGSADDRQIRIDHRFKLHPGHALGLNSMVIDTAVRHVFFHPEHDPSSKAEPAVRNGGELPQSLMFYEVLADGHGVERRWLDTHPERPALGRTSQRDDDVEVVLATLTGELDRRQRLFESSND
ncbi:hypothetical protein [Paractinoplanes deccanensis]|uniref:hypothetical protein n=1 Tax=Paractinoplanes deccanensis TaxID=113561 RepID=UPI001944026E|nr:hypothetical protein [Actinoplanes deccanensis]